MEYNGPITDGPTADFMKLKKHVDEDMGTISFNYNQNCGWDVFFQPFCSPHEYQTKSYALLETAVGACIHQIETKTGEKL